MSKAITVLLVSIFLFWPEIGREVFAVGLEWQISYDEDSRIIKAIDPAGREIKVRYQFSEDKQLQRVVLDQSGYGPVTHEFDRFGRRIRMIDTIGAEQYRYDEFGRLVTIHREGKPVLSYSYDTLDRLVSTDLGSEFVTSYSYDFLGRLATIGTPIGNISYEYQVGQRMVVRTLPNGVRTTWKFRPDGRLESLTHVAADSAILLRLRYAYRPDGLIAQIQEFSSTGEKTLTYEYDNVQRLVGMKDSHGQTAKYQYDKLGNRTGVRNSSEAAVVSVFDWSGKLTRYAGQDTRHDAIGNLLSYARKDGSRTFSYDGRDLLKTATTPTSNIEYKHDGDGYLVERSVDKQRTSFIPDPFTEAWHPLIAIESTGRKTFYVWEGDSPLLAVEGNNASFFLNDHLGSVRGVIGKSGNKADLHDYDPFGRFQGETFKDGLQPGFAGLFFDPQAVVYLTRARAYDPELGRFLQLDPQHRIPFGSQDDLSLYSYSGGDPINCSDRSGAARSCLPGCLHGADIISRLGTEFADVTKTAWQGVQDFFNSEKAAQWYADRAQRTLSSSHQGNWILNGLAASGWDLLGGFIGGGANVGQIQAQILWSFLPSSLAKLKFLKSLKWPEQALKGLSVARNFTSFWGNLARGDLAGAAWNIVSLGGTQLSLEAKSLEKTLGDIIPDRTGQLLFRFGDRAQADEIIKRVKKLKNISDTISRLGIAGKEKKILERLGILPSNVGGIYLRGAGEALRHLGSLKGVAFDQKTGRLILLSGEQGSIDLPPLRLDDVVTVFRSVYQHGEAPFVSIDPNPKDPEGSLMLVRHGKGTADMYPGWILFESDRVMKTYSLGYDNVTRQQLASKIDSYKSLLKLGFSGSNGTQEDPIWERFWIVPAEVQRRQSRKRELTLLDVPLKVNTQPMVLRNGLLEPAPNKKPSKEADAFAQWFTRSYSDIASEATARPPAESGITTPVAFFDELRRIALISAIVETLRDQGVPFPSWMRDYFVKSVPVTPNTPAITVKDSKTEQRRITEGSAIKQVESTQTRRIYGGVQLSPEDKDIHVTNGSPQAEALVAPALQAVADAPPLTPVSFEKDGAKYRALALPGNDTQSMAANQLEEIDLVVPVQRGSELRLIRHFHSFFRTPHEFGGAWTLDLPFLETQRQPVRRTKDRIEHKEIYELTSPLNSLSVRFSEHKRVPEVNSVLIVPDSASGILGLSNAHEDRIGFPTQVVLFRDGQRWHFDKAGNLAAIEESPLTIVYRRDQAHHIRRIEGWYGKDLRADIRLEYDKGGHLLSAQGTNGDKVTYHYDTTGFLKKVEGTKGAVSYQYRNGLVTAVVFKGKVVKEFTYAAHGQLQRERDVDGVEVLYQVASAADHVQITASTAGQPPATETVRYDSRFRPVSWIFDDRTSIHWRENKDALEVTFTLPEGQGITVVRSLDGRKETWRSPEGGVYEVEYDAAGRFITLRQGKRIVLRQQWRADGQPGDTSYETFILRPEYREDGVLASLLVTAVEKEPQFSRWLKVEYDAFGRAEKVTDYSGLEARIGYDKKEEDPSVIVLKDGGVKIGRDNQHRVQTVQTSWGSGVVNTYGSKGNQLIKAEFTQGTNKLLIDFAQGKSSKLRQFDGSAYEISYYGQGVHEGQIKTVQTPDGLVLTYEYDAQKRLTAITYNKGYRLQYRYDAKGRFVGLQQIPVDS